MITLVLSYYENGGMLDQHVREWTVYTPKSKERMRAIIVDDGSPGDLAASHIRDVGFPVSVYRINDNVPWNIPGARNLGMHVASDGWCLLTDIDHLLEAEQADRLIYALPNFDPQTAYTPERRWADGRPLHRHLNSYFIQRRIYWLMGGCDEDWSGWWGAAEGVFRKALKQVAKRLDTNVFSLTHYGRKDIPDASTREWGRRGSEYDWGTNPLLLAKYHGPVYRPEHPLRFDWERVI